MSDTTKHDAVLREFGCNTFTIKWPVRIPTPVSSQTEKDMATEIVRLREENAALTAAANDNAELYTTSLDGIDRLIAERDRIAMQFAVASLAVQGLDISDVPLDYHTDASGFATRTINELVRLRKNLTIVEAERDSALAAASGMSSDLTKLHDDVCEATGFHEDELCDEVQRAIDYQIETDTGSFDTVKAVKFLRHQRDRALRILAALREPSETITNALFSEYWDSSDPNSALRAAVAAAEQEVGRE